MTETSRRCTIEVTQQTFQLVHGFPRSEELTEYLSDPDVTVMCLFPESYRSEQTQVQLRNVLRAELDVLGVPYTRCMTLVVSDPSLGDALDTFDFSGACEQVIRQLTPRYIRPTAVPIPAFGTRTPSDT